MENKLSSLGFQEHHKLKQALNHPWKPEQDGFEFSLQDLTPWMRQLTEQADDFHYHGYLPDEAEIKHND